MTTSVFERLESNVRTYCRDFPAIFVSGRDHILEDAAGKRYIDFLSGAGALNYGHNNTRLKYPLLEYIESDGVFHMLDLHTTAKQAFLQAFAHVILEPRGLDYKVQFAGPTGTNAIEAALKLARKVTGRRNVIAFTNAFHGMSLGALAASANRMKRNGAGVPLEHVTRMPFDGYFGETADTVSYLESFLADSGSGIDAPAAILVETIQAEGGINVAQASWLQRLAAVAAKYGALLILDEIQTGCGRTGPFFSFESAGLKPDLVCLSKSISGLGLPMAIVLIRPELDVWQPGEHNGTFRGNNLAFTTATAALDYWRDDLFEQTIRAKGETVRRRLVGMAQASGGTTRGVGLLQGLTWRDPTSAAKVSGLAFERGLIVETCGARSHVLKLLPPLTIALGALDEGLDILEGCVADALAPRSAALSLTS